MGDIWINLHPAPDVPGLPTQPDYMLLALGSLAILFLLAAILKIFWGLK